MRRTSNGLVEDQPDAGGTSLQDSIQLAIVSSALEREVALLYCKQGLGREPCALSLWKL